MLGIPDQHSFHIKGVIKCSGGLGTGEWRFQGNRAQASRSTSENETVGDGMELDMHAVPMPMAMESTATPMENHWHEAANNDLDTSANEEFCKPHSTGTAAWSGFARSPALWLYMPVAWMHCHEILETWSWMTMLTMLCFTTCSWPTSPLLSDDASLGEESDSLDEVESSPSLGQLAHLTKNTGTSSLSAGEVLIILNTYMYADTRWAKWQLQTCCSLSGPYFQK